MNSFARITILLFFTTILVVGCKSKIPDINTKPNVLLLYMDDLRPELGCYGKNQIHSPNIDALAAKGIQFNNAYCNVPVCGASRASMLTSMLPTKERFLDFDSFVQKETPNAVSLPMLFKNNGYTTVSDGKVYHHLDDRMGDWDILWRPYAFDKNDTGLAPTDYWQSLWKDYQVPKNRVEYKSTNTGPAYENANVNDSVYIDGLTTNKVIRDLKKLKKSGKPFFLAAGFISPHLPFNSPQKYSVLYDRATIKQPYNNYIPKNAPKISISNWPEMRAYSNIPKQGQVSDATAIDLIHGYYATVSYVDALIGSIMKTVEELNLDKNTIVVLVSDHGYNLQEHTQWAKFTNYNTSTQVPLIIYNPKATHNGTKTNALTELVDIYPTLAELCGLKLPENQIEGKSLVPILKNPSLKGKDHILIKKGNGFTIKTADYSYTEFINAEDNGFIANMLYDHQIDKDENNNVVNDSKYREAVIQLKKILYTEYKINVEGSK
ncbi:sulfatase [Flavobacterium sp. NG2]|uniref:sulfatase n=1 Tax=Flavobacterium sp. NG2 TaxID=3097547 RepID=UPI002A7F4705|nr:sulfatase [Flavobacterium sp. NG2]WPR71967.1 sulfatase [Flavobacterium sp. NG2]